ncbi:hypothetical protein [Lactococcus lactis]|uniref:hypothetical protein n=1 Tax=Lactococcus lactis TaxID=1358 RepID=UPI00210BB29F|nr:hypothetical protein [Lactococcus lactis]MCQ4972212.1 hypothetical protein [Lactococcus lactis]MCQ4998018.1 hypothetical protein [Lactococcus lactis]
MKILKEFNKMKMEFNEAEKANKLRKEEHNRKFEQLRKESEEQSTRVAQRFQFIRNK